MNADQRPDAFFDDLAATLDGAPARCAHLLRDEAWDLLHRRHHRVRPAAPLLLEPVRRPGAPAHERVPRLLPPARRRDRRARRPRSRRRRRSSSSPTTATRSSIASSTRTRGCASRGCSASRGEAEGLADLDPASKAFVLDPGRVYVHRAGRFPLGVVEPGAEAEDLLGARARGAARAARDRARRAGGRPAGPARLRARRALPRARSSTPRPTWSSTSTTATTPRARSARTEVFGRSALTGMHTYDDSLFFVNRPGVPTDDLDIIDLAPTILTLLGVDPRPPMDGRVLRGCSPRVGRAPGADRAERATARRHRAVQRPSRGGARCARARRRRLSFRRLYPRLCFPGRSQYEPGATASSAERTALRPLLDVDRST